MAQNETPTARQKIYVSYWFGLSVLFVTADYFSGPFIQFPVTYLIPVALASWYHGRWWGLLFAAVLPLIRLYFNIALWSVPWTFTEAGINAMIRFAVLSSFALVIDRTANQTRRLSKEVLMLEGLLPICSHCKKIRDQNNDWQQLEMYISERSSATFTHGLCPDCLEKNYGDLIRATKEKLHGRGKDDVVRT